MATASAPPAPPTPLGTDAAEHLELVRDLTDQLIDIMLNFRQSGHPGGSRSKVPLLTALLLGGAMRWDIRDPGRPRADRFILGAGHTVPVVYAALAVLAAACDVARAETGRACYALDPERIVRGDDLVRLRRRGGLPGHAEMSGKTHLLKFNTGPSGHGLPVAAGQALALRRAGLADVRVFVLEGEGGLTPGAAHEVKNSAWGLGLGNLLLLLDWNDFGIDSHRVSSVVPGTPREWFGPYGWRTYEASEGSGWQGLLAGLARLVAPAAADRGRPSTRPGILFQRTRKGRGYGKHDAASHGAPHAPMNCDAYWETKRPFMQRYGITLAGYGAPRPDSEEGCRAQTRAQIKQVLAVLAARPASARWIADRLLELATAIPPADALAPPRANPCRDESLFDPHAYPPEMWAPAGTRIANKEALGRWGAWINDTCRARYGRPLFLACSADLAQSTGIAGFAGSWGWYDRSDNPDGALLPQEITEFTNAALMAGVAATNLAGDPWHEFDGFYGACSTYGAFSYLKYGPLRLFSQTAQDSALRVGKVLWVAGHSGPETADDSRTHFGIFAPGVTQLFPRSALIDLHPWEHNEVPVLLAAAMRQPAPLVALHLTRPPLPVPDRAGLGLPPHFVAARGAYVVRPYRSGAPRMGTVIVQGSATTDHLVGLLPELERRGLNVKIVAALSPQLFAAQEPAYRATVLSETERWDAMCITNRSLRLMSDWVANDLVGEYSVGSDWDDRWRTGGTVAEVLAEAHLDPAAILAGIERFVRERPQRLARMRQILASIEAVP